jgi:predicted small integral membrane protein
MMLRVGKFLLVAAIAGFHTLVVLNNTTDFDSNFQFVRHVMMMDSTFPRNHVMWRAVNTPALHTAFYLSIILWEIATTLLCWWGALQLGRALRGTPAAFQAAKKWAIAGLTLSMLIWLAAFLSVGGEWFLMWQSKTWNGQESAFRMFTVVGIVLLLLVQPETEDQA